MPRLTFTDGDTATRYYTPTQISENITETPEGFLVCRGVPLTRTGALVYSEDETHLKGDARGLVTMYRTPEEVFHADTIASFEGKPVTIDHPDVNVDPSNWAKLAKGVTQNVRRGEGDDSDKLVADLLITDADTIALVKNGLREVSCGYEAEYTQTVDGEGVQTGIIGNHVALVERGRAGPTCAIHDHERGRSEMSKLKELQAKMARLFADAMGEEPAKKTGDDATLTPEDIAAMGAKLDKLLEVLTAMGATTDEADPTAAAAASGTEKKTDEIPAELAAKFTQIEQMIAKLTAAKETPVADADPEAGKTPSADTLSRVEILAPSLSKDTAKDIKAKALTAFNETEEGKGILKVLTGDKLNLKDAAQVNSLFVSASEVVKQKRGADLASTKTIDAMPTLGRNNVMTADKINEANDIRYGRKPAKQGA